jgi:hypothetical protein
MTTVTGIQYKLTVYDSIGDKIHGNGYVITEVFIPTAKLVFNSEGHAFHCNNSRQKEYELDVKTVQIDMALVEELTKFIVVKAEYDGKFQYVNNITRNFFK